MTRRVLVTGASGFIGRHVLGPLLERGYEVHAVGRGSAPGLPDGVRWHAADLLDAPAVRGLVAGVGPTHLLHLAWYVEHGRFWHSAENLRWVGASLELARAFHEAGGSRAVFAGTCAEYAWEHGVCRENDTPVAPATLYGMCKDAVRRVAEAYGRDGGPSLAWGRIFFLYGPGEAAGRLVPSVVGALLRGELARCTHGEQVRDFMHVSDVAGAFAALLDAPVEGVVNVASGEPVRIRDVVAVLGEEAGRPDLVRLGALSAAPGDPAVLTADVRRLREEVG
ncbi:MAG TPA: NAD-dependent epimerase/dehydratase family protein, partial [Longimicrobium sp.]